MKKFQILIILLFILTSVFAQPKSKKDSIAYPIREITFDASFRTDSFAVDTSILKLHILNPAFVSEHSFEYLTRLAYPIKSNSIISRLSDADIFISANYLQPYLQDSRTNFFCDTKVPFTSLTYKEQEVGTTSSEREEQLRVFHTQNFGKKNNLGLLYNLYSTHSTNNFQRGNDHALSIFYRHTGENYLSYNLFYFNSFTLRETGGLTSDTLIDYRSSSKSAVTTVYPVNLYNSESTASSSFLRLGLNSIHEIKLKKFFENENDTVESTKDYGSFFYNLNLETTKRSYYDSYDSTFYKKKYYNGSYQTADSVTLNRISNKLVLNSPEISKYLPNLRFTLNNDLYFLNYSNPKDTSNHTAKDTLKYKSFYPKTSITADISQRFNQIWWNAIWDFNLLGYGVGDHAIKGIAKMYADKAQTIALTLNASEEMTTPSFMYDRYISNHYIWPMNKDGKLSFNKEKKQELSAVLSTKKPDISLGANYISDWSYVYFDSTFVPKQVNANKPLIIMSYNIKTRFELWKFSFQNDLIYQKNISGGDYMNAPPLIYYNSTEFQYTFHFFTGGKLYTKLGVDAYYTSKFIPDGYNPALGIFYVQNDTKTRTGGSAQFDVHLTCKIKTVSFFFKYSNAAAPWVGASRVFSTMHYPVLPSLFSYGINWLFYD